MLRRPTEAATVLPRTEVLPSPDTSPPGTSPPGTSPPGTGRHREPPMEPDWLRQWGVSLVSGAVILVTVLIVATVLLVTHDDEPVTGPEIQAATGSESQPADPVAEPSPSPTATATAAPSPSPSRATPAAPMDRLAAFAADVQQQINTGNLDPEAGRSLLQGLGEAARRLNKGQNRKAAERLAALDRMLTELRRDGKLSPAGFAALDNLDPIIDSLRGAGGGRG